MNYIWIYFELCYTFAIFLSILAWHLIGCGKFIPKKKKGLVLAQFLEMELELDKTQSLSTTSKSFTELDFSEFNKVCEKVSNDSLCLSTAKEITTSISTEENNYELPEIQTESRATIKDFPRFPGSEYYIDNIEYSDITTSKSQLNTFNLVKSLCSVFGKVY